MEDEVYQLLDEVDHGVWAKKSRQSKNNCLLGKKKCRLDVWLGLAEALNAIARLPLATFLEEINAFEAFQDVAFNDETGCALEAFVL
jgi:hypothetical protein